VDPETLKVVNVSSNIFEDIDADFSNGPPKTTDFSFFFNNDNWFDAKYKVLGR